MMRRKQIIPKLCVVNKLFNFNYTKIMHVTNLHGHRLFVDIYNILEI